MRGPCVVTKHEVFGGRVCDVNELADTVRQGGSLVVAVVVVVVVVSGEW